MVMGRTAALSYQASARLAAMRVRSWRPPALCCPAVLEILSRCGGPTGIAKAGRRRLAAFAKVHARRMGDKLVETIMTALDEQTVPVPGTAAGGTQVRGLIQVRRSRYRGEFLTPASEAMASDAVVFRRSCG
jgi:hypothetical protein